MESLSSFLSPVKVKLNDLLLDPNNPRFAELGEESSPVPESRFAELKVQQAAFEKMRNPQFAVSELRDTIRELGFLPMDRLVVRKWRDSATTEPKYVVVEGNRRVTALKWLIFQYEEGKVQLTLEQLANYQEFEVLLLDESRAPQTARWILPGLRHVSGIKEWGPYQKARMVHELRQSGKSPQEVAQSLGLSTREANQLWRAFLALEQMKKDEEFGEFADATLYSYFVEVLKRANVRNWWVWDDEQQRFTNTQRLQQFYSWIRGTKGEDGEDSAQAKLPEAKSVRELSVILEDQSAMSIFTSPDGTLTRALARVESDTHHDLAPAILSCDSTLGALSPDSLRSMTPDDVALLTRLSERIERLLRDRKKLIEPEAS